MDQKEIIAFGEYLTLTKGLAIRTVEEYLKYYRMLDLELINNQEYVNAFAQEHKNNITMRGMLYNMLRYHNLHKIIDMPEKSKGRKKKRIVRILSPAEIDALRQGLYSETFRHGLIFDLMYQGALRLDEIRHIQLKSFEWIKWLEDVSSHCNLIILGKGNKERRVLIKPETAQSILDYFSEHFPHIDIWSFIESPQYLFTSQKDEPISEITVYMIIKKGGRKYLGKPIRPHEIRHNRADELNRKGAEIIDIKNYLGHSSLATTEIYLHKTESKSLDNLKEIMKSED